MRTKKLSIRAMRMDADADGIVAAGGLTESLEEAGDDRETLVSPSP